MLLEFACTSKSEQFQSALKDLGQGFEAQLRHLEIPQIMNVENCRCLPIGIHHPLLQNPQEYMYRPSGINGFINDR